MSVLSRNELRIVLCPSHAALLAIEHRFTRRGIRHEIKRREIVAGDGGAGDVRGGSKRRYDKVLAALDAALPGFAGARPATTLILSNHFARFMLVPWSEGLNGEAERMAYAQHCFRNLYGDAAKQWELRLSPDAEGAPQLSSAVDRRLLAATREVIARHRIGLASIQPYLMAAYNAAYGVLRGRSAWFGLVEPGVICLGLLHKGRWQRLRSLRIGPAWESELPRLLEREACVAGGAETASEVLLSAPAIDEQALPQDGRWRFRRLGSAAGGGLPGMDWGIAMGEETGT